MRSFALIAAMLLTGCARPAEDAIRPAVGAAPASGPTAAAPTSNPAVGGVTMPTDRPIADTLAAAPTLGGFVRAMDGAGLTDTLRATGPFTVFAPTDAAVGRLQPGTVEALMKPENRAALTRLLGLHIVPERLGAVELIRRIAAGNGRTTLTTVAGEPLTVTMTGGIITLTDIGGDRSYIETADVRAANGIIHVVNGVLVPRLD